MNTFLRNLFVPVAALLSLNAQLSTAIAQTTVTQVAAGLGGFNLFVTSDGNLWGMGANISDQLGANAGDTTFAQRLVSGNVTAIAAGGFHTLFLKSDGSLWAMGDNQYGQLGDPSDTGAEPQQIVPANVTAISAGGFFSLFITSGGGLWAMGDNTYGQLGNGTVHQQNSPVGILPGGVTAVAAGYYHSLFLKSDGSLWAMGYNADGQLGDGYLTNSHSPKQIVSSGVSAIAAGYNFSLMLKTNGSLWAWGNNDYGQLGNGSTNGQRQPVQIVSSNVAAISAGYTHSLFLKKDGSLWAMGDNSWGELGDNTYTNHFVPEPITTNVITMAAGETCSVFVKSDGTLWGMGYDADGELGDGASQPGIGYPEQIFPLVPLMNNGFELGSLLGWYLSGNTNSFRVQTNTYAHSGRFGLTAGPPGSLGYVYQFPRVHDSKYLLKFSLGNFDGATPNEFRVGENLGTPVLDWTNVPAIGWTNIQLVIQMAPQQSLTFGFRNDHSVFALDDITLTQPRPVLNDILMSGNLLVLQGNNAMLGATYTTLTSTNVSLPISQWKPIATTVMNRATNFLQSGLTDVTNGLGDFTIFVPNGVTTNASRQFYLLQLQ